MPTVKMLIEYLFRTSRVCGLSSWLGHSLADVVLIKIWCFMGFGQYWPTSAGMQHMQGANDWARWPQKGFNENSHSERKGEVQTHSKLFNLILSLEEDEGVRSEKENKLQKYCTGSEDDGCSDAFRNGPLPKSGLDPTMESIWVWNIVYATPWP